MKIAPSDTQSHSDGIGEQARPHLFALSLFCPCILLGRMRSEVMREECGGNTAIGCKGCAECALTCVMCAAGWPLSPCLCAYINAERGRVSSIYRLPNTLKGKHNSWCGMAMNICCWPLSLVELFIFLRNKKEEGMLHYEWSPAYPSSMESTLSSGNSWDAAVVVVGPEGSGKTELVMKLTGERVQNYGSPGEGFDRSEVRVGLRPIYLEERTSGPRIPIVEMWDIPWSSDGLRTLSHISAPIRHVLLVYDCSDSSSLLGMKDIYKELFYLPALSTASFTVVAAKNDHLYHCTTRRGSGIPDPCEDEVNSGAAWAASNGLGFLPASAIYSCGIPELMKIIRSSVDVS
eukprot:CAMPEP_0185028392 /NCGR_PEP_ID=MMETSP1103-20130426/14052_1 /TAXON_ID=36769 /ORGANISM="Paraphysomonas bandaiensis, Strain Caron Lab Isolate" /LENGTH=346 /DNA_ID=CAMNT_0027562791 /DNA_START=30 /DNA_END=1070 /DNA_ORIENTATION=-